MAKTPAPTLIGSREACERLGITRSTLNYWMLKGKIAPAQTISANDVTAAYLWAVTDVERLAERAS